MHRDNDRSAERHGGKDDQQRDEIVWHQFFTAKWFRTRAANAKAVAPAAQCQSRLMRDPPKPSRVRAIITATTPPVMAASNGGHLAAVTKSLSITCHARSEADAGVR